MDIQQLQFFITTAEYGHLSHAAEILNISQSSLSYSINKLESELGVSLFDRIGRNIKLNQAGIDFKQYALDIIQKTNEAKSVLNAKYGQDYRSIIIQTLPLSSYSGLFDLLYSIESNIKLIPIAAGTPAVLSDNLLQMEADICLSPFQLDTTGLNEALLYSDEIVALVSSKHPLKDKTSLTIEDLKNQQFISGGTAIASMFLDSIAAGGGFEPDIQCRTASHEETLYILKKMPYMYLVSKRTYKHMQDIFDCSEIFMLTIDSPLNKSQRKLYWRKKHNAPAVKRLCEAFLSYFTDGKQEI